MIFVRFVCVLLILSLHPSCNKPSEIKEENNTTEITQKSASDSVVTKPDPVIKVVSKKSYESIPDSGFVIMNNYARGFMYDMKYAIDDNFLKKAVYPCAQCLLRKEVADALQKANDTLIRRGLRIKFYDCYRPLDVQKQMWLIYPDARYVGNPHTTGSIHNRGGAVDITLVDLKGKELDMGTGFDHFGKEAHHAYRNLPDTVLSNRRLLKETMETYGFKSITSEWWHYNFKSAGKYSLSNFSVKCEEEEGD